MTEDRTDWPDDEIVKMTSGGKGSCGKIPGLAIGVCDPINLDY